MAWTNELRAAFDAEYTSVTTSMGSAKLVGSFFKLVNILKQTGDIEIIHLQPHKVGIHRSNRGGSIMSGHV